MTGAPVIAVRQAAALALAGALLSVAVAAPAGSAARSPVPRSCPKASILTKMLRRKVHAVSSRAGPMTSSTTQGFGGPDEYVPSTSAGYERTCVYSSPVPIVIAFSAPVSARSFAESRKVSRRAGGSVTVRGLGDAAWAAKAGGELFVHKGMLDIVISAPASSTAELRRLARRLL